MQESKPFLILLTSNKLLLD